MKKILSLLTVITLTTSGASSVISCSTNESITQEQTKASDMAKFISSVSDIKINLQFQKHNIKDYKDSFDTALFNKQTKFSKDDFTKYVQYSGDVTENGSTQITASIVIGNKGGATAKFNAQYVTLDEQSSNIIKNTIKKLSSLKINFVAGNKISDYKNAIIKRLKIMTQYKIPIGPGLINYNNNIQSKYDTIQIFGDTTIAPNSPTQITVKSRINFGSFVDTGSPTEFKVNLVQKNTDVDTANSMQERIAGNNYVVNYTTSTDSIDTYKDNIVKAINKQPSITSSNDLTIDNIKSIAIVDSSSDKIITTPIKINKTVRVRVEIVAGTDKKATFSQYTYFYLSFWHKYNNTTTDKLSDDMKAKLKNIKVTLSPFSRNTNINYDFLNLDQKILTASLNSKTNTKKFISFTEVEHLFWGNITFKNQSEVILLGTMGIMTVAADGSITTENVNGIQGFTIYLS